MSMNWIDIVSPTCFVPLRVIFVECDVIVVVSFCLPACLSVLMVLYWLSMYVYVYVYIHTRVLYNLLGTFQIKIKL
jgi:hypothetical protein